MFDVFIGVSNAQDDTCIYSNGKEIVSNLLLLGGIGW